MKRVRILQIAIGIVSLLIVGVFAVGISVLQTPAPLGDPEVLDTSGEDKEIVYEPGSEEELIQQRMQVMHEAGVAELTAEELELMEGMSSQEEPLSAVEEAEIVVRMQKMLEAE